MLLKHGLECNLRRRVQWNSDFSDPLPIIQTKIVFPQANTAILAPISWISQFLTPIFVWKFENQNSTAIMILYPDHLTLQEAVSGKIHFEHQSDF